MPDGKVSRPNVCGWNPCDAQQIGISRLTLSSVLHLAVRALLTFFNVGLGLTKSLYLDSCGTEMYGSLSR
jgi:hypothetical protein